MDKEEFTEKEFPQSYNRFQASWLKGAYQVVSRGSESAEQTVKDLHQLLTAFKAEFPEVWEKMGEQRKETARKTSTQGWLHECPVHKTEMEHVAGGISRKTGKPYNARWQCQVKGCKEVEWEKDIKDDHATAN